MDRLQEIERRYLAIEKELGDPHVVQEHSAFRRLAKERAHLADLVETYRSYRQVVQQLRDNQDLVREEKDSEIQELAQQEILELTQRQRELEEQLKILLLPKDPHDEKNVFLEIRAGTGGEEASIFAADLFRMYTRYAENRGWDIDVLSANEIGIGGYKEIIFLVKGKGAYSRLKYESGVHRVQRVPVTESQGRIHTSAATVAVLAEVDDVEIDIPDSDIRIDVYKSAGAGGQNVQKNSTAIRITHHPTGMVVQCQDERSQLQNRLRAMSILRARLYEIEEEKRRLEVDEARRSQVGTGERSEKIRTYNYPQSRVTDHRVNISNYNLPVVMEGDIDEFIDELATRDESERLAAIGLEV